MNTHGKGAVVHISPVFGADYHVAFQTFSETGVIRHRSNLSFGVPNFGNTSAMGVIIFSKIVQNLT